MNNLHTRPWNEDNLIIQNLRCHYIFIISFHHFLQPNFLSWSLPLLKHIFIDAYDSIRVKQQKPINFLALTFLFWISYLPQILMLFSICVSLILNNSLTILIKKIIILTYSQDWEAACSKATCGNWGHPSWHLQTSLSILCFLQSMKICR